MGRSVLRPYDFGGELPPLPLFLRKNVKLKEIQGECVQECHSKRVTDRDEFKLLKLNWLRGLMQCASGREFT
jgi:hypothetical protein